jgi:hypothetical protein
MKLFYHHVGQQGADEDFSKTVFARKPISLVEESVPEQEPLKQPLLSELRLQFPSGDFNCWGVPAGAQHVVNALEVGDVVLLVESAHETGIIPALCEVKVFFPYQFPTLSNALWGAHKYPYIFFFETERLDLPWREFLKLLGYKENFNPRGKFYSIADERLAALGGSGGFVSRLRREYSGLQSLIDVTKELEHHTPDFQAAVRDEVATLQQQSDQPEPQLFSTDERAISIVSLTPRSEAFRISIRNLYNNRCAMCGLGLHAPDGQPEVEAAHIFPKRLGASDDLRNGICLCRLHHWAFDCGWITIADDLTILVRNDLPRSADYSALASLAGKSIRLPADVRYRPHPLFLAEHRKLHGF